MLKTIGALEMNLECKKTQQQINFIYVYKKINNISLISEL